MSYALPGILGLDCAILTNLNRVKSHFNGSVGCTKDHPVAGFCRHCCGFSGNWNLKVQQIKLKVQWFVLVFVISWNKKHLNLNLLLQRFSKIWTKAAPAIWKLRRLYNPEATLATPADLWLCALTRGETQVAASDWNEILCVLYALYLRFAKNTRKDGLKSLSVFLLTLCWWDMTCFIKMWCFVSTFFAISGWICHQKDPWKMSHIWHAPWHASHTWLVVRHVRHVRLSVPHFDLWYSSPMHFWTFWCCCFRQNAKPWTKKRKNTWENPMEKHGKHLDLSERLTAGFSVNVSWPQIVLGFRVFRYFGVFGTTDFCKFWNRDGLRWIWTLLNIWKQSWRTAIVIPCLWKCQSECTGRYNICWTWPPKPPWSKCHLKQSAEWKPWSFTFCLYLRRKPFDTNLEETFNVWFSGIFMLFFVLWWSLTFLL